MLPKYEKNPTSYKIEGNFYDSSEYNLLTNLVKPTIDNDYVMDHQNVESEIEPELKRKKGPGRPSQLGEKPLMEFGDTWIKEQLNPLYNHISKVSSELKIPFDRLVAKMCLRHYYTAGPNYSHEKGQIFNKVVTLVVFSNLFITSKI